MECNRFEQRMHEMEYFHALRLLPGAWTVVRVDGRGFSRPMQSAFDKPFDERWHDYFDERWHDYMVQTATVLLEEMHGLTWRQT